MKYKRKLLQMATASALSAALLAGPAQAAGQEVRVSNCKGNPLEIGERSLLATGPSCFYGPLKPPESSIHYFADSALAPTKPISACWDSVPAPLHGMNCHCYLLFYKKFSVPCGAKIPRNLSTANRADLKDAEI